MTDESLRARLEALNRGPLPSFKAIAQHEKKAIQGRAKLRGAQQPGREKPASPLAGELWAPPNPIGGLMHRGDVVETEFGQHLRVDLRLEDLWQGGPKLLSGRQEFLRSQLAASARAIEPTVAIETEFAAFIASLPDRALALDLETCGLAGSALFLIGLLRHVGGVPRVQLLFARNYSEEPAVLASLWQIVSEHEVLVTFNGKTFDWPMVVERSIRHRLPTPASREQWVHIDVLHHARRRWRKQLPNCRLQTLERYVCRRMRAADIPGHAIPGVYANFVRTGFEREMDTVLYHNALDLVTLFDLTHRLAA
jgi:uncharacterized protein YprB with RNaseH-like and TPR domain